MGPRPRHYTLEREDSNGPYSPENCKWASGTEQARNTSRNRRYTIEGVTLTIPEFCESFGLKYLTLFMRIKRGEPLTENILRPPRD